MNDASPIDAEPPNSSASIWSDASLLGVALIWGINIPLMKTGLDELNVFVFNAIRLAVSALVLTLFGWRELRQGLLPKTGITWKQVVIYAVLASGFYQLLFVLGMAYTTSGNTALIMATVPMWTAMLALVFLGEVLHRVSWWGLVIALAGTVLVAAQKGDVTAGGDHLLGNLIILAAALFWAGGTVYSRPLLTQISPMQLSALASAIAIPMHVGFAWGHFENSLPVLHSPSLWMILLYSGIFSTGLALPMWNYGVRHAGAAHAAIIQNLIPLVAIATAWFSRGETATIAQLSGGVLILGGLVIMRTGRRKMDPAQNTTVAPASSRR